MMMMMTMLNITETLFNPINYTHTKQHPAEEILPKLEIDKFQAWLFETK